jgi:uncharacterized membrane protein YciS (DUF1049 family)
MRVARRVLAIAAFVGLLVAGWRFAAENPQPVQVHYLVGRSGETRLWGALLGAFTAGGACVAALAAVQFARLSMLARRYRKVVARLEAEVHELRNLPLVPDAPEPDAAAAEAPLGQALPRGS